MSAPLPGGRRPPSHAAYYVALGGCVLLLILLTCYLVYFCISRISELSECESLTAPTSSAPRPHSYPVQPVVRNSATTMAKLCKQLPTTRLTDSETSLSCQTTCLSGTEGASDVTQSSDVTQPSDGAHSSDAAQSSDGAQPNNASLRSQ